MGLYLRYALAFLVLLGGFQYAKAATRTPFNPSSKAVFEHSPSNTAIQTPNGSVGFFGPEAVYNISIEGSVNNMLSAQPKVTPIKNPYDSISYPYGPSQALPGNGPDYSIQKKIAVKPKAYAPKAKILSGLKNGLKFNPAQLVTSTAIMGLLAGVGWVMDPANNSISKKESMADGQTVTATAPPGINPGELCNMTASQTMGKTFIFPDPYGHPPGTTALVTVAPWQSGPSGWYPVNNCTRSNNGYWYNAQGYWPQTFAKYYPPGTPVPLTETNTPVSDADLQQLDAPVNAMAPSMLADILKDTCKGSPSPSACFQEMEDRSQRTIEGPTSVAGPTSTTTKNYTKPDGTLGTQVETTSSNYTINYGNTYYDTKITTNKTTTIDGNLVSSETSEDSSTPPDAEPNEPEPEPEEPTPTYVDNPLPPVTPFYVPKYLDGLAGVWNDRSAEFEDSEFVSFLESFVPQFSGSCPSWSMSFGIGSMGNFGSHQFMDLCFVFAFIKVCMLLGAVFLSRAIIFGG